MSEILVHVTRGSHVESVHRGDLTVVDTRGHIVYSIGDPHKFTFWRSAAKPFQVLPLVEAGGIERFSLTGEELALMTSSHGGEERHVQCVQSILDKLGRTAEVLQCGTAPPMYQRAANDILKKGGSFTSLTNSCSGKHSSMIALAIIREYEISGYFEPIHPVQHEMLRVIADIAGLMPKDMKIGIDGCGVPVFGLPLYNMAIAYAHLSNPNTFPEIRQNALRTIASAMTTHPFFVAGSGRLDTSLMEITKGRILAKLGAEGVYNISVMNEGLGLTLKIEDGNTRAIDPVVIEVLNRLSLLTTAELEALQTRRNVMLRNHRKQTIGQIKAVF